MVWFANREDAARQLATRLTHFADGNALVLAIPRGAVPMGRVIADALNADLDVVLVRKLGAPGNPEFAVGAIDESGWRYVAPYAASAGASAAYLDQEAASQLSLLRQRRAAYTPGRGAPAIEGRTVIVVDDGIATGATMIAALHAVRAQNPARLVCATPVAAADAAETIAALVDEFICIDAPMAFGAVGNFYREFGQVSDAEVIALLKSR